MPIETLLMQPVSGDNPITYSARQIRAHLLANLFSREGVIDRDGGHFKVTQRSEGANFTVDVAIGGAAVFGDDQAGQGPYSVISTTKVNRTVPAASTTVTRTHRVILRTFDRLENSGLAANSYYSDVVVQADTAPAAALPPSSFPLASIAVPANAVSVQNSMISEDGLRPTATVGTPARTGAITPWGGWYGSPSNPPAYSVTPDGLVLLSGVIYRGTGGTFTTTGGAYYEFAQLPTLVRPAAGRLNFILIQGFRNGVVQFNTNGVVKFATVDAQSIVKDVAWLSLDGLAYRIGE